MREGPSKGPQKGRRYGQRQAVAAALSQARAGKIRKDPRKRSSSRKRSR